MQLDDYVAQVHAQLTATASLGDERTRHVADALSAAATPAVRLAILAALGAAADEITSALLDSPGAPAVAIRLDGEDVRVEVTGGAPEAGAWRTDEQAGGETTARISLRLSEALKAEIETAAGRAGVSVNTWLVRAAGAALSDAGPGPGGWGTGRRGGGHRTTGWING